MILSDYEKGIRDRFRMNVSKDKTLNGRAGIQLTKNN
jgi:hypothetical protein